MSLGTIIRANLVLAYAVTDVHPGAGRSPGVVDLPVERDIAGYPVIPRSSFKGALKEYCFRVTGCLDKCASQGCLRRDGRIDCEDAARKGVTECLKCCCLFGPEPEQGEKGASVVITTDLTPLAIPAWAHQVGLVYVTTPWLLQRAYTVIRLLGESGVKRVTIPGGQSPLTLDVKDLEGIIAKMIKAAEELNQDYDAYTTTRFIPTGKGRKDGYLIVRQHILRVKTEWPSSLGDAVNRFINLLNHVLDGTLVTSFGLVLVRDPLGKTLVDRLLVRRTRIRLQLDRKVVAEGALWTEEYIPAYTVFIGAVTMSTYYNEFCTKLRGTTTGPVEPPRGLYEREIERKERLHLMLGGKTTLASGLLNMVIAYSGEKP